MRVTTLRRGSCWMFDIVLTRHGSACSSATVEASSKHCLFDDADYTAGTADVCLCCGEDVDFAQDYDPVPPFCSHRRDVASVGVQFL